MERTSCPGLCGNFARTRVSIIWWFCVLHALHRLSAICSRLMALCSFTNHKAYSWAPYTSSVASFVSGSLLDYVGTTQTCTAICFQRQKHFSVIRSSCGNMEIGDFLRFSLLICIFLTNSQNSGAIFHIKNHISEDAEIDQRLLQNQECQMSKTRYCKHRKPSIFPSLLLFYWQRSAREYRKIAGISFPTLHQFYTD